MDLATAMDQAVAHGWSDDSRYLPSFLSRQVSRIRDGFQASVTINTTGTIRWGISPVEGQRGSRSGTAADVPTALRACEDAISSVTGTLF